MEKIAHLTGVLCISVFVMGVFYQIGGFDKTARIIRFVTALCIISMVFKGIKEVDFMSFPHSIYREEYDFEDSFYDGLIFETQLQLEELIKKRLAEKNISYNFVQVHILEQNGNLTAEEIIVICDKNCTDAVYNCISDMVTENTIITIGE